MIIILDTFPTSSVAKRRGRKPSLLDDCREWVGECELAGHTILVPAIAYYEVLRELELRSATSQIARLRDFSLQPGRFIPLTTAQLDLAARLWGDARRAGLPTASLQALDGDVILVAQALSLGLAPTEYLVATTNVAHLSRFVPCRLWSAIVP
jgi:predicted nucleic acid-binding protein